MDSDYDYLHQQSTAHTTQLSPCAFVYEGGKQARQAKEQARCTVTMHSMADGSLCQFYCYSPSLCRSL